MATVICPRTNVGEELCAETHAGLAIWFIGTMIFGVPGLSKDGDAVAMVDQIEAYCKEQGRTESLFLVTEGACTALDCQHNNNQEDVA